MFCEFFTSSPELSTSYFPGSPPFHGNAVIVHSGFILFAFARCVFFPQRLRCAFVLKIFIDRQSSVELLLLLYYKINQLGLKKGLVVSDVVSMVV